MHDIFSIRTKDQLNLFAQCYQVKKPTAVVCLIHGMGEHSGRYAHVAKFFNTHGISMFTMDLRGHGRSEGKRGHMPSYDNMMDDVSLLIQATARKNKEIPIFLYGHSMGGNLVLNYGIRNGEGISGIIATSPYLHRAFELPVLKIKMATVIKNIIPTITQRTGLDVNYLSKDKKNIENYEKDPLVHDKITPSFFVQIEAAGRYALQHANMLKVPTLLLHGKADKITDYLSSEAFAKDSEGKCIFKLIEGGYHEMHNDEEKNIVLDSALNFIEKHILT